MPCMQVLARNAESNSPRPIIFPKDQTCQQTDFSHLETASHIVLPDLKLLNQVSWEEFETAWHILLKHSSGVILLACCLQTRLRCGAIS